jgi:hypothetical protein
VRLQDVTATGHYRKAEQQVLQIAEEQEQDDVEREQGIQQQKREVREREEAYTGATRAEYDAGTATALQRRTR